MTEYPEYNPLDEAEQLPPLTELEEQQEWNQELRKKNEFYKKQITDIINNYDGIFKNNVIVNQLKKIVDYGKQ